MPARSFDAEALGMRIALLAGHHVDGVPWNEALVLVVTALGCSAAEAAAVMEKSQRTIEHQLESARQRVVPQPLEPTTLNAVAWARLHRGCCMASAWAAVLRTLPAEVDGEAIA